MKSISHIQAETAADLKHALSIYIDTFCGHDVRLERPAYVYLLEEQGSDPKAFQIRIVTAPSTGATS